jgi:hypothetical protein
MKNENMFELVVQVLGTSPDKEPQFRQLVAQKGTPEILVECDFETVYLFRHLGVQLSCNRKDDYVNNAFFHYGSAMAQSGNVEKYNGDLIAGISFGENQHDIERKMGLAPIRTITHNNEVQENYFIKPLEFRFTFGSEDGLNSVSIWHERWLKQHNVSWVQR